MGMPHLVEMDKKYRDKGLVIIAAESQESTKKEIQRITDRFKITFAVTHGVTGPARVIGLPTYQIFDPSGKMIFNGQLEKKELETQIKQALKKIAKD